jgi:3-hydroxyacyl-[acyl-carrier-protein] dehydratase
LIDRIDRYVPFKSVEGRKLTSLAEEYWTDQGDERVMPAPLVLESLCQAATWLIVTSTERRKRAALLQIGAVDFLGDVRPGDVIDLVGEVSSMSEEMAVLAGTASVGGRTVLRAADVMCALIDADDLQELEETERMQHQLLRETTS